MYWCRGLKMSVICSPLIVFSILLPLLLLHCWSASAAVSRNDVLHHDFIHTDGKPGPKDKKLDFSSSHNDNNSRSNDLSVIGKSKNNDNNKKEEEPGVFSHQFNHINEEDYDSYHYGEEDSSYYDYEIDSSDEDFIEEYEEKHKHGVLFKPAIGKCCSFGEALNAQGICTKVKDLDQKKYNQSWFPDVVFNGENLVPSNISNWEITEAHQLVCEANSSLEIISDMSHFTFISDGSLFLVHHKKLLKSLDFCVDQELGKPHGRVIRSCFSKKDLCGDKHCVRKCCPHDMMLMEPNMRCSKSHFTQKYNFRKTNRSVLHSNPSCQFGSYVTEIGESYKIDDDGNLVTEEEQAPFLSYCLDYFYNEKHSGDENAGVNSIGSIPKLKAIICFPHNETIDIDHKGLIVAPEAVAITYGVALIASAICLAFAAIISWRLPELRSLHGKCQLCHLGTMFFFFICLGIVQLGTRTIPSGLCKFFAVVIHACALSSFLWLNLLCVNIYLTFRSLRPPLAARRDENKRLIFLSIYAWGIPVAFCIFLYILDSTPGRLEGVPRPEYGVLKCLISNREAEFAYLFGPVGVLLLFNGILFCLTAQELLCGLWRLDNSDSINFRRKSMGIVVAKLGIVMGMAWIFDTLSWAVGHEHQYIFYAADLFTALQGVFICIVLIWRKRVLEVLQLRKPSLTKDDTLTSQPFLTKTSVTNVTNVSHLDTEASLVAQDT